MFEKETHVEFTILEIYEKLFINKKQKKVQVIFQSRNAYNNYILNYN